ncbi:MAG: hypothetical protein FJY80_05110 [Candidatus Aminicenantes bacterium]|nr:hypothetical protein [Candidatus Aminicenantes bacterium]
MNRRPLIALVLAVGGLAAASSAQERFIDVRQAMADALTSVKAAAGKGDWAAAAAAVESARTIWDRDVKPLILEGVKTDASFEEYAGRAGEVEAAVAAAGAAVAAGNAAEAELKVNAAIWGISHHPRGFDLPAPRYSAWDWVFGLSIGLGFCLFATWFGLYLRRSYYGRFPKATFVRKGRS